MEKVKNGRAGKPNKDNKDSKIQGEDLADDYVRTHVPKGRWADTWDLFKTSFSKLVIINVLVLLFFVPGIVIVYIGSVYTSSLGMIYPFAANVGLGYHANPNSVGLAESVYLSSDVMFYSLLIVAGLIASVGIAGAAYSIRKLINTHGMFTVKGFFHGVKVCYFNVAIPVTIFMVFFFGSVVISDWSALYIKQGGSAGGAITAKVFMIIATVIVGIICAWFLAVGVSYKAKLRYLIKNSFVLMAGSIVQTIFMGAFALIPVWLFWLGQFATLLRVISYIIFIIIGFSFILLCWLSFTQWVFDLYVTPAVKKEKEAALAQKTPKQIAEEEAEERRAVAMELLAAGRSELIGKPIKPIATERAIKPVGAAYGRNDLNRVKEERGKLEEEVKTYENEHINEPKYAEYNKMFAEREKALQDEGGKKGKKKKKISSDNLLG